MSPSITYARCRCRTSTGRRSLVYAVCPELPNRVAQYRASGVARRFPPAGQIVANACDCLIAEVAVHGQCGLGPGDSVVSPAQSGKCKTRVEQRIGGASAIPDVARYGECLLVPFERPRKVAEILAGDP